MIRVGVDIGGTFTDFALVDQLSSITSVHKQLTTPVEPWKAVLEGISEISRANSIPVSDITEIIHGTTLVTNALLERRGAKVGMLVTKGFRDLFDIGREQRYDLYDLRIEFAEPIVARDCRREITERTRHDGRVLQAIDPSELMRSVRELIEVQHVSALSICFLHSHVNPMNERMASELIASEYPDLHLSVSSGVFPYPREFERWTTTCANAYVQPLVNGYMSALREGLRELGFNGSLYIVSSSGGLISPDTAQRFPVRLLESGPAAGVLMSSRIGRELDVENVLSFDLGGTTAKGALIRQGSPTKKYTFEAAHVHKSKSGSGIPLQIPVIDMCEIGSGGGSIVSIDKVGLIRVGPRSAGAQPGPGCYGLGGTQPTLTDANLALGYLNPAFFLGGRIKLDRELATRLLQDEIASKLGLDIIRAAWGVHEIANEDICRAFRMHATERAFDCRGASIVAFGGGGPIHASRIARKLQVPDVIYPAGAGVMSALGMLVGAMSFELVKSHRCPLEALTPAKVRSFVDELKSEAMGYLLRSGVAEEDIAVNCRIDARYVGQGYEIEVQLPPEAIENESVLSVKKSYEAEYFSTFRTVLDQPIEVVGWKVEATGPEPDFVSLWNVQAEKAMVTESLKERRLAYFPWSGGMVECPVYDRYTLRPGACVTGPCLVEERESTCLLDDGDVGVVDARGNIRAKINV